MKGTNHEWMAEESCNTVGVDGNDDDIIKREVTEPDSPSVTFDVPNWVVHDQDIEDGLEKGIEGLMRYVGHYYNADPFFGTYYCGHNNDPHTADFDGLGGAPEAAQWHFDKAEEKSGDERAKYVGRTLHYTQDMANPLHTGMGWEQVNLEVTYNDGSTDYSINPMDWLHKGYEEYIKDRWNSDREEFSTHYGPNECDGCYGYHKYNSAETEVSELANYTGTYSEEVFHRIDDEGTRNWREWSDSTRKKLKNITQNCLHECGLKDRGLLHRYYDDD